MSYGSANAVHGCAREFAYGIALLAELGLRGFERSRYARVVCLAHDARIVVAASAFLVQNLRPEIQRVCEG